MTPPGRTRPSRASDLPLADRPGFLIRRLHQIHVALFLEECAAFGITPVQYSVMTALEREGPLDQVSIGREIGIDRANATAVVRRLEDRGLLQRAAHAGDSRVKLCSLTSAGRNLTRRMLKPVERAHARLARCLHASAPLSWLRCKVWSRAITSSGGRSCGCARREREPPGASPLKAPLRGQYQHRVVAA